MPKRFVFNLQAVLDQREREERDRQLVVAGLERERVAVETRLRELQGAIAASKMDMRAMLAGGGGSGAEGVNVPEVRLQAGASLHLAAQAQRVALELSGLYRRVELARAELLKAATARKAVELLKEKRHAEWREAMNRAEAAAVDEVATVAFVRKAVT